MLRKYNFNALFSSILKHNPGKENNKFITRMKTNYWFLVARCGPQTVASASSVTISSVSFYLKRKGTDRKVEWRTRPTILKQSCATGQLSPPVPDTCQNLFQILLAAHANVNRSLIPAVPARQRKLCPGRRTGIAVQRNRRRHLFSCASRSRRQSVHMGTDRPRVVKQAYGGMM